MSKALSRRTVLRGMGVTIALPWLEAMTGTGRTALARAPLAGAAPLRMACIFMPNGVHFPTWAPTAAAEDGAFTLSPTLEPLESVRQHVNVLRGLTLDKARANGDGPGDHARSSASFLTGHQARKTAGNDIRIGVSVDQFAARQVGVQARFPSLELGCEQGPSAGNCDSGYSCAYSSNVSWRDDHTPMPKMVDPAAVFERLFGDATQAAARAERLARRKSILDFVREDARRLNERVGANDRRKLDQFQTSVREVELQIERARREASDVKKPEMPAPEGIPNSAREHQDMMYDLMLLAFQTDATRISTLMLGNDGSNKTYPEIGVNDGHHHLSHHQNNQEMVESIKKIDRFCVERFARFIDRLSKHPEGEGSLLDNTMVLFGGGIGDGNRHNHDDLPILLAGRAGGQMEGGRLLQFEKETPLCNLYVTMLQAMGCEVESFGDSTGPLKLG